jgi:hypothetical protein
MNAIEQENSEVRQNLNINEIFEFNKTHKIEVLFGADLQYHCWIDGKCYCQSLTPLHSMVFGVESFKQNNA